MALSSPRKEVKYEPLASGEPEASTSGLADPRSLRCRAAMMIVPVVVTFTIALVLGWVAGQNFSHNKWDGLIRKKTLFDTLSISTVYGSLC